jgi:hypothetical protein
MHHPHDPADSTELAPYGELVFAEIVDEDEPGPQRETEDPPADERVPRSWTAARRVAHCARTTAAAIGGHTLPGLRNALSAARHWLGVGYMSDDEIRRRIVNRPLEADRARREEALTAIRHLEKKLWRKLEHAAAYGLEATEKQAIRDLSREIRRRRNGLDALQAFPFTPEQPTPEQIRRARSLMALGRFTCTGPASPACSARRLVPRPAIRGPGASNEGRFLEPAQFSGRFCPRSRRGRGPARRTGVALAAGPVGSTSGCSPRRAPVAVPAHAQGVQVLNTGGADTARLDSAAQLPLVEQP